MFTLKRIVFLWCPYEKLGIVRTQIHYVTLHFRDRQSAASLRYRNHCFYREQRPYPVWFSFQRKSYPVYCEHSL